MIRCLGVLFGMLGRVNRFQHSLITLGADMPCTWSGIAKPLAVTPTRHVPDTAWHACHRKVLECACHVDEICIGWDEMTGH
jgi:hypothetical protein